MDIAIIHHPSWAEVVRLRRAEETDSQDDRGELHRTGLRGFALTAFPVRTIIQPLSKRKN